MNSTHAHRSWDPGHWRHFQLEIVHSVAVSNLVLLSLICLLTIFFLQPFQEKIYFRSKILMKCHSTALLFAIWLLFSSLQPFQEKINFRSQIHVLECPSTGEYWNISGVPVSPGADWVIKPAMAKILKRPFLAFLSSFFFVSNRPWADQNQAAHVAIAKKPQRPVRLWVSLSTGEYWNFSGIPVLLKMWRKVYFKSQILVHKYWTILDHIFLFGNAGTQEYSSVHRYYREIHNTRMQKWSSICQY